MLIRRMSWRFEGLDPFATQSGTGKNLDGIGFSADSLKCGLFVFYSEAPFYPANNDVVKFLKVVYVKGGKGLTIGRKSAGYCP